MKGENSKMVDDSIVDILFDVNDPKVGWTVRDMTRRIWNYSEGEPAGELFYNRAKFVERRIGAIRHRIFEDIRNEMKAKKTSKVKRPKFIPYALPVGKYWYYINGANFKQMPYIIEGLKRKADGLISNAEVLEAVF
jgi:hypothetical protein